MCTCRRSLRVQAGGTTVVTRSTSPAAVLEHRQGWPLVVADLKSAVGRTSQALRAGTHEPVASMPLSSQPMVCGLPHVVCGMTYGHQLNARVSCRVITQACPASSTPTPCSSIAWHPMLGQQLLSLTCWVGRLQAACPHMQHMGIVSTWVQSAHGYSHPAPCLVPWSCWHVSQHSVRSCRGRVLVHGMVST
jgi:hypothetical protein